MCRSSIGWMLSAVHGCRNCDSGIASQRCTAPVLTELSFLIHRRGTKGRSAVVNKGRILALLSWFVQVLLALLFAVQGTVKLMGSPNWVARFSRWGYPSHFYLLIGGIELAGAVLLVIPRLSKFGMLLLAGVMLGAAGTHLVYREPQIVTTLVLLTLLLALLYFRVCGASTASSGLRKNTAPDNLS